MTDNEKAATFIGWAPAQVCDRSDDDGWCQVHNAVCDQGEHAIVAPDMTDPRNYMRALKTRFREAVKESNADKYEEIHAALVRILACEDDKAAVEYLADVYDTEHA